MSNITLSAGIRQNLLSLQQTSADLTTTQEALSTGNKVNSASENPSAYFTSQNLTNAANQLSALLDQVGQGQQTINAATDGLTGLTSLLQQALSTAQQAQQAPSGTPASYNAINVTGDIPSGYQETIGTTTGTVDLSVAGAPAAGNLLINVGSNNYTVAISDGESLSDIESAINTTAGLDDAVTASDTDGKHLILTAKASNVSFTVNANAESAALGVTTNDTTNNVVTSTDLWQLLNNGGAGIADGDTLTVSVNGGATTQIKFGTAAGEVQTLAQLKAQLQGVSGLSNVATTSSSVSFSVAGGSSQNSITIGTSGDANAPDILTALGLTAGTQNGVQAGAGTPNSTRTALQTNYNSLLTQIDQLADDASYNGVNLLNSDNLVVDFNASGSSSLTIAGVNDSSGGLGLNTLSNQEFQTNSTVQGIISDINNAISTVQAQTETFGVNSGTITTRQTFTNAMINTLQTGASNLVAADQNEESADLLTEQTQQQLEISALSIANQANQSVLKLFG